MRLNWFLLSAVFLPCVGAQPELAPAVFGYAYDPGLGALRSVRGIPGAAILADPLDTGFEIAAAAVAPRRDYALAISAGTRDVRLIRWHGGNPSSIPLAGALNAPDRIVFSPSGDAALLYDAEFGRLQLVTGLPDAADAHTVPLDESPTSTIMAVADGGTLAIAGAEHIRIFGSGIGSFSLPLPTSAAIAFDRSGTRLLAVTRSGDIYIASHLEAGLDLVQIASATAQTADPVGAQLSADGSTAFVASPAGIVTAIDISSGAARSLDCQCSPTALEPFGRAGMFRLTGISNRPIILFDAASDPLRFWFVPADAARSAQ
jgi:hypothetical protein